VWQTSRSWALDDKSAAAAQTWADRNPGLHITRMDDALAARFIERVFGGDVADVYNAYPLGVMRADFFR
jgi:mannosyltransferase OCH1-like enzyme